MLYLIGLVFLLIAGILSVPVPVALIYGELNLIPSFIIPAALCALIGLILRKKFEQEELLQGNAMVLVALSWTLISIIGSVPYMISIDLGFLEALFESVAGFSATGLTVLQGSIGWTVEVPPNSILFWRSLTQWLGGVGVIVLFLAIIPRFGKFTRLLYESEAREERILPRIKDTAKFIWKAYMVFTVIGFLGFFLGGMNPFAAINHSMTGIATGGFSVTSDSFAGYGVLVLGVGVMIMMLGAISFVIHRRLFDGDWKALIKSSEVKLMLGLIGITALAVAWEAGLKDGIFQTTSALTGTGFSTTGLIPASWSSFQKGALTLLMVIGGGYGSTSSAIKLVRSIIIIGAVYWIIKRAFLPDRAVVPLRIDGEIRKEKDVMEAAMYAFLYIIFLVVSSLAIMMIMPNWSGMDVVFESASAQGNVGLSVGITEVAPPLVRGILIVQMLAGRLEILPYIALLHSISKRVTIRGKEGF